MTRIREEEEEANIHSNLSLGALGHVFAVYLRNPLLHGLYSFYRPRKDERLSRPGWLTYSGRFTHISGHPSAAVGRAQDSESLPVKD